jgi:hypothetical protein
MSERAHAPRDGHVELAVELPEGVLPVRAGPGANCSSIGSVVDMLFAAAVAAGVLYVGVAASLGDRTLEQVGEDERAPRDRVDEAGTDAPHGNSP